jgi:hypothetical protein
VRSDFGRPQTWLHLRSFYTAPASYLSLGIRANRSWPKLVLRTEKEGNKEAPCGAACRVRQILAAEAEYTHSNR